MTRLMGNSLIPTMWEVQLDPPLQSGTTFPKFKSGWGCGLMNSETTLVSTRKPLTDQ
jgi:hypothetical protein